MSSHSENTVHRFDANGRPVAVLGPLPNGADLIDIAVHDDVLYAVDNESSIHSYSTLTGRHTGITYSASNTSSLQGISIDSNGLIYITRSGEGPGAIHVLSRDGSSLRNLTNIGSRPQKIQFDSHGNLRVTDGRDSNIYVLTKIGRVLHKYPTHLSYPSGLFVDDNDNMMVADRRGGVSVFNERGLHLHDIGGFKGCADIRVSASGSKLWVSDMEAGKIYLFKL